MVPTLVIAGTHSGVGKTTVATGVMAALTRCQLQVQPFKAGPDYIDPTYHRRATGRSSRNLDSWMLSAAAISELFSHATTSCDVAIIEGVMGLYDGHSGDDEAGSTAALAKLLRAPVLLVVDAAAMARSAAALVLGYQRFDPALRLVGVILNNVAGPRHAEMVTRPIEAATGLPVLGYLPCDQALALPERHLGLVPEVEGPASETFYNDLATLIERQIDLGRLLALAREAEGPVPGPPCLFPATPQPRRTGIAIALDRAFSFYYQDSLDLLQAWGAELLPFSPIHDAALPAGTHGIYLGGGFPEVYAAELAANRAMQRAIRRAARRGIPLYAECGGLMYLGQSITDFQGHTYPMVGLIPLASSMQQRRPTLGYRTVRARWPTPVLAAGQSVRGHEFHWSTLDREPPAKTAPYDVLDQPGRVEGYARGSLLASYIHLHFGADPTLAPSFVQSCAGVRL